MLAEKTAVDGNVTNMDDEGVMATVSGAMVEEAVTIISKAFLREMKGVAAVDVARTDIITVTGIIVARKEEDETVAAVIKEVSLSRIKEATGVPIGSVDVAVGVALEATVIGLRNT